MRHILSDVMSDMSLSALASMSMAWMTTSFMVGAGLAVIATLAHHLARRALPSRFIWAASLVITLGVTLLLPARMTTSRSDVTLPAASITAHVTNEDPFARSWSDRFVTLASAALTRTELGIRAVATTSADLVASAPPTAQWMVVLAWPLTTLTLLGLFGLSYRRQAGALARASRVDLHGVAVHVGDVNGPVVLGLRTPRIAVPAWLLSRDHDEQRLVVQHEQSHIEARDPQLLIAACITAILLPWNAAVWFMLSRLRLAIELDCDARVLARGISARRYGELLIDLSAQPSLLGNPARMPISATAFSYRASHLERRLRTMTARSTRFLFLRRASVATLGGAALLAACRAELPTSAELQAMDVTLAEQRVARVSPIDEASTEYFVNGTRVDRAEATKLTADRIATIDVHKTDGGTHRVYVVTADGRDKASAVTELTRAPRTPFITRGDSLPVILEARTAVAETPAQTVGEMRREGPRLVTGSNKPFDGLVLVDGERRTRDALAKIDPNTIVSVEVVKGAAAIDQYGPDGANGVIRISTKK